MNMNATNEIKVGAKVKLLGGFLLGTVKETKGETVTVAWRLPGRMNPVWRVENARDLKAVES